MPRKSMAHSSSGIIWAMVVVVVSVGLGVIKHLKYI